MWDQDKPTACRACRYWRGTITTDDGELYGECHRYPPQTVQQAIKCDEHLHIIGSWLVTEADEFCGEFVAVRANPTHSQN